MIKWNVDKHKTMYFLELRLCTDVHLARESLQDMNSPISWSVRIESILSLMESNTIYIRRNTINYVDTNLNISFMI